MRGKGVKSFFKKVYLYRAFLVMLLPAVAYTLIFSYYPMTGIAVSYPHLCFAATRPLRFPPLKPCAKRLALPCLNFLI